MIFVLVVLGVSLLRTGGEESAPLDIFLQLLREHTFPKKMAVNTEPKSIPPKEKILKTMKQL